MTSRTGFLTMIATGLLAVFQPAFAQDYLVWQSNFGFAPAETVEILIEKTDACAGSDTTLTFTITNNFGIVIGLIETTVPASDPPPDHRIRGFGFVAMTVEASPDGVLLINGEPFDDLTASPTTGRYSVGISLSSSRAPGAGGGNAPIGNATLSIVAPDGTTRASAVIQSDPGFGITKAG
jgi:hypothetical protein